MQTAKSFVQPERTEEEKQPKLGSANRIASRQIRPQLSGVGLNIT